MRIIKTTAIALGVAAVAVVTVPFVIGMIVGLDECLRVD